MELDKRIKDISTIQTILRHDVNCIGCKGYFFDDLVKTADLSKCAYGTLVDIVDINGDSDDHCFKARDKNGNECLGYFKFFISEDWVLPEEPKKEYRPYTLAEWVDQHEIGEVIHCRNEHKQEFHVMYTGYVIDNGEDIEDTRTTGRIMLINMGYSLESLFNDNYEICINGEWQPFGVIEDE